MSFPTKDTTWGKIQYDDKEYDILDRPLSISIKNKINHFKQEYQCGVSSAPWSFDKYEWEIKSNKLYLSSLKFKMFSHLGNLVPKIFNQNKLFASWVNSEAKLVISKKEIGVVGHAVEFEREILILFFSNGELTKTRKEIERYTSKWAMIKKGDDNA